jgi:hypothetical protein
MSVHSSVSQILHQVILNCSDYLAKRRACGLEERSAIHGGATASHSA